LINNLNKMTDIEKIAKIWQIQLNMEYEKPEKNVRISFKDIGPFCEYIAIDFLPGYKGGGSGGMGFDLYNKKEKKAFEVKSCCTIQNAKCIRCGAKFNNLFSDCCPDCGSKKFIDVNDSRFGINAKETLEEHDKKIFGGFILTSLSEYKHDAKNNDLTVLMEWFKLDFENDMSIKDIRLKYFKNQKNKGRANTCNLLPNSYDFFKLNPLKIAEAKITINYADLNRKPKIKMQETNYYKRVSESVLKNNAERELFKKLKTYDAETKTAEAKDFTLNFPYRNKNLGKERGDTRTNVFKRLIEDIEQ